MMSQENKIGEISTLPALVIHQWLPEWEEASWDRSDLTQEPPKEFFAFSIGAIQLRRLSGIYAREAKVGEPRSSDVNVQRQFDKDRSNQISRYVKHGFPYAEISSKQRQANEYQDLRKPGWLPTSIIINILKPGDEVDGRAIEARDAATIDRNGSSLAVLTLPPSEGAVPPFEIIDGQHRLRAFDDIAPDEVEGYELPVVAFHGLHRRWQAYLFWTINVRPKRITASLAYDLYPLLRGEDWLEKFEGHPVYRETRAQELVQVLWHHPESLWHNRINMLKEPGRSEPVSQSAWVRTLMATFIRRWQRPGDIGGLYGAPTRSNERLLPWSINQQAALLIVIWQELYRAVSESNAPWAVSLREAARPSESQSLNTDADETDDSADEGRSDLDEAFVSEFSLLSTDQGIRGVLAVINDLLSTNATELGLFDWRGPSEAGGTDDQVVTAAIAELRTIDRLVRFIAQAAEGMANFDWRTSGFFRSGQLEDRIRQGAYRGSGGYRLLRDSLLGGLKSRDDEVGQAARTLGGGEA